MVVHNALLDVTGMKFQVSINGGSKLELQTCLLGRYLLGPLALCIALVDELGLSAEQIKRGTAKTEPFEHRMKPRRQGRRLDYRRYI